ncbi:MAG: TusE/DsrC/DsvC family sulfur relay protein [Candidatus Eisenbacteria bacterium]|uniref:TusE/DsrC/DsvC family sulfur relay protein n=1 Tax=Eiseniibacteriota bacterium TaxID=2212470 RepID=A0A7Y2H0X7_UNCEI|nr:TusE/DsrC/DsvC family sulfur relay protein [Candidatus Eisenbacteria bacterium]
MDKELAGAMISVNEEGYLTDLSQWTREIGIEIAREEGIEMTDQHWSVIDYIQDQYRNSASLSLRSLGKRGPVSIKELYQLFPDGPLKKSSRIAGIPKPASCI